MSEQVLDRRDLLLPEGARLVHIGPHKTGTTSLQAALYGARPAMLAQGVRHVGRTRNPASAVRAVTGQNAPTSTDTPPSIRYWRDLVGEFRRAREPRVVVSSEFFSWATPDIIQRIVNDLDRDRLHIVVTLRPLGKILPSQWQQNVQAGAHLGYEDWLRAVLGDPPGRPAKPFWKLHRHDQLIARWADVVGPERMTAVVVDEHDHSMLLRAFGEMLGLSEGTLAPDRDLANRSMTLAEIETVRHFNVAAREMGVSRAVHAKSMRFGSAIHMKMRVPGPGEARIETPQWALDRAAAVASTMIPVIASSGVRIVGDLDSLTRVQEGRAGENPAPEVQVTPEVAARMAMGVLISSGLARPHGGRGAGDVWIEPIEVARVSTPQLIAVILRRVRGAVLRGISPRRGRAA